MILSFFFSTVFLLAPCCCCFFGGISIAKHSRLISRGVLDWYGVVKLLLATGIGRQAFFETRWMFAIAKRRNYWWTAMTEKSLKSTISPTPRPGKGLISKYRDRCLLTRWSSNLDLYIQLYSRSREDNSPVGPLSGGNTWRCESEHDTIDLFLI